jgi:hypothetical protein
VLRLRTAFLSLIAYLVILFVFAYQQQDMVRYPWMIVFLALVAVVSILAIPILSRQKPAYLVTGYLLVYFLVRIFCCSSLWGGIQTYITLVESLFLIIAVLLATDVGNKLNDFTVAVRDLTLGDIDTLSPAPDQAEIIIEREFLRSTRHQCPLSMVIVKPDEEDISPYLNRSVADIQRSMMTRYALARIVRVASTLIRRTDLIVRHISHQNDFVIFSPDTSHENAKLLIERLKSEIETQAGIKVHCGYATYPNDGLNFEDLIEVAGTQIQTREIRLQQEDDG